MRKFVRTMNAVAETPYHYRQCGLSDVFLLNGFTIENDPEYGELVSISDVDQLHSEIALSLIAQKQKLTGEEVRFIRLFMNDSQNAMAVKIGVDEQTIARWEKGTSRIGGPADLLMRLMLILHTKEAPLSDAHAAKLLKATQDLLSHVEISQVMSEIRASQEPDGGVGSPWQLQLAA